ncbi:MAG TPA: hypothetical protein DEA82_04275 [Flavobacteriaceae bacterium]|jgi:hypothetical protein|nr:hypothetical protein [Flavobacteriaceae bacterium]MAM30496.1 hypothetical protein [Flavobacteriaceae bacterium]HBR53428.1 hypothetical protein [Flavobacteriaceae bacterium]|tara:strand:- start:1661 stop:2596 length:936 start_codon:yes stop_codon:yes gene_type:complete
MKKLVLITALLALPLATFAQTKEELEAQKAEKQAEADKLQSEADAIQAQIDALPGWKIGAFGTVGVNLSSFDNWYAQGTPNVSSGNIGVTFNGFANLKEEKYFWRNALNVNVGWVKFDDKDDPTDDDSFQEATDVFNITSLYGRNIFKNVAASALAEYRTTVLNNFNDPGYLDVGVGATWTPIENLVVVVHPLNYNFVFAEDDTIFESSLGAKFLVDYTRKIGAISFKSNLSAFYSYESSDLSNWTWVNSLGYKVWKSLGVGFEFGLRGNKQEALNFATTNFVEGSGPAPTFENVDNELQSYWLLGITYAF